MKRLENSLELVSEIIRPLHPALICSWVIQGNIPVDNQGYKTTAGFILMHYHTAQDKPVQYDKDIITGWLSP